jgi:eukaryotic-like serine/threonine-protein kinase
MTYLDPDLPDLEQEFRLSWRRYDVARYQAFLERTDADSRIELLARMLSAELEYHFQPPSALVRTSQRPLSEDDDDERAKPSLRLFALRFPELLSRQDLVLRLIVLEYALRLRFDTHPPNPDSYLDLCPLATSRLGSLLELTESKLHNLSTKSAEMEGSHVSKSDSTIREADTPQSLPASPLPYNLGCFLLTRCIGRGGMGYVHAAIDLRSAAQVAVKVMRRVDAWSVYRFNEEFSWLSQLYHPHLVRLFDAFSDGDVRYFSMELVEGKTIRDWFRRVSVTDDARWKQFRTVLSQLASAIHFLHSHNVVHRDIKCSNVMITPRRRAVLLDLGLAMRQSEPASARRVDVDGQRVIGTLQYLAPEGLCNQPLTPASDWYSFGVLIFEVMCDQYPPITVDPDALDPAKKYQVDEDALRSSLADCPSDLADLCVELLSPNPAARPKGYGVLSMLGNPATLDEPSSFGLLGRGDELEQLNAAVARLRSGESTVIRLSGESGLGKSALLEYWQRLLDQQLVLLIAVRCYRQDHAPLRLMNLLVQQLVTALVESHDDWWLEPVRTYARSIGRTFPQISQLVPDSYLQDSGKPLGPDNAAARREISLEGVRSLLAELSQHRPLVIIVDDAQWADGESLRGLCSWFQPSTGPQNGLIVFSVEEDEETRRDPSNADCPSIHSQQLELQPLNEESGRQLIQRMSELTGIRPSPAAQQDMLSRSGGNPFLLLELFRGFQQASRERLFSEESWLTSDPEASTVRRFRLLPIQAENVLQYLAVAGQPMGFHQLQIVSRIAPNELQSALSYLDAQGWVRTYRERLDLEVEIANGKYISLILASIPAERMQRRHYRTARMLLAEVPPPWPRVGHHFWLANKRREAAACYMEAARVAAKTSAFDDALRFLDRALIEEAQRSLQEHRNALRLQADCLAGMGSAAKAAEIYQLLSHDASDLEESTLLECLAGEQRIRGGELDEGLSLLRSALAQLEISTGKNSWLTRLKLQLQILLPIQRAIRETGPLRYIFGPLRKRGLFRKESTDGNSIRPFNVLEQCLTRVSTPLTFLDSQLGSQLVLRLDLVARDHGTPYDQAQTLLRSGLILSCAGRLWRPLAIRKLRLGRRLVSSMDLISAKATTELCMYIWLMLRGLPARAEQRARHAIALYQHSHPVAQWEIQFLNFGILTCLWHQGKIRELQQLTSEFRRSAECRSDAMSLFWMNVNSAIASDLSEDKPEQAQQALSVAAGIVRHHSFQAPRFLLWHSNLQVFLYMGDWRSAQQLIAHDWHSLNRSLVLRTNHYLSSALCDRICINLLQIREEKIGPHAMRQATRDARWCITQLRQMRAPVFTDLAMAYQLVVDAWGGNVPPSEQWNKIVSALRRHQHHLMAAALQWQQSLCVPSANAQQLKHAAERELRDAGCLAPDKLLNLVLPLPLQQR